MGVQFLPPVSAVGYPGPILVFLAVNNELQQISVRVAGVDADSLCTAAVHATGPWHRTLFYDRPGRGQGLVKRLRGALPDKAEVATAW